MIGPVHNVAQIDEAERFSPGEAARDAARAGSDACALDDFDAVVALVEKDARPGDVVVALSNGAFGGVVARLAQSLAAR